MNENSAEILINNKIKQLSAFFEKADEISLKNQRKVLDAFIKNKVALRHFSGTTGYGYDDIGRDTLKKVFADVFHTESSCISPNIVSGTHAISLALYSVLKRGDKVLSVSGMPYDTIQPVIFGDEMSLKSLGISFDYICLKDGDFDYEAVKKFNLKDYAMIYVQKSRGYEEREAISVDNMERFFAFIRKNGFEGCIFVDNCYGEFVEEREPTDVGADLIAGSLIKNAGGGIAPTGGYIAGKAKYIKMAESRMTAPPIAAEVGSYAFGYQYFFQGLFLAPHVVNQAIKGSMLIGAIMQDLGFETLPAAGRQPYDITRSVKLGDKDKLIKFVQTVQNVSPIDSFLTLEAWDMPGYKDKVIMAAGCFIQGSSIELSADGPIKEPYIAYIQGGLTFEHIVIFLKEFLKNI